MEIGGGTSVDDAIPVVVDVTPPTAVVTAPAVGQTVQTSHPYHVQGTATDENFETYSVSLGVGSSPSSFTQLLGSESEVTAGDLHVLPTLEYPPLLASGDQAHLEFKKPRLQALSPRISLELPSAEGLDDDGRPIVRGQVPVRVTIDPEDAGSMTDALFEVAFYVDLTFFFEDEESTTPMTWMWDTSKLSPGPHLLTVNVFSYDGRIGCLTRSVVITSGQ